MTFLDWLLMQQDREGPVGEFARDVCFATRIKKGKALLAPTLRANDRAAWYIYLRSVNAGAKAEEALEALFQEYESITDVAIAAAFLGHGKPRAYDLIVYRGHNNRLWPQRPAGIIDKATGKPPKGTEILWGYDAPSQSFCPLPESADIEVRVDIRDGDPPKDCH